MPSEIRSFIAIELPESQRQVLEQLQESLKQERAGRYVRWVAPAGIHLTVKFLGGVEARKIPAVERAIAAGCVGISRFRLTLTGLGAFPNVRRPNVVWVGIGGDVELAERLAGRIEDKCEALGFARETRPFAAHLTLGRVKRDVRPAEQQFVGEMITHAVAGELGGFTVERVSLMKSDLTPRGSIYTRLFAAELPT